MANTQPEFALGTQAASIDFLGKQYRFVSLNAQMQLALTGANAIGLGVIQDEPKLGYAGNVLITGVSRIVAGGPITARDNLKSDAEGRAVVASGADQKVFGIALEDAALGHICTILLTGKNIN